VNVSANITNMETALTWLPGPDDEYYAVVHEADYQRGGKYINYLQANFMRAFGADWYAKWAEITLDDRLFWSDVGNTITGSAREG
jgi:hypothetical protein